MERRTYHFSGRVQGVGFRYTVSNIAQQYAVQGYVRNVADGGVELVMEGSPGDMDRLVDEVKSRMEGFIRNVRSDSGPATGEFKSFAIRH